MTVYVRPGESLEKALKRFNSGVTRSAILRDVKGREEFSSKRDKQRNKWRRAAARRKAAERKANR